MQGIFVEQMAFSAATATRGRLMSATAMLERACGTSDDDISECLRGVAISAAAAAITKFLPRLSPCAKAEKRTRVRLSIMQNPRRK